MGIQKWGAFGGFQKKTGPLVGHWLNGQNVITPVPHPSQEPPSTAQLNQRAVFKMMVAFLRILKINIRDSFTVHKEKESPWSAAMGYNLKYSIAGTAPNFTVDYPNVMFTKGDLSNPITAGVTTSAPGELTFTWTDFVNPGCGGPTDEAGIVIYSPTINSFVSVVGAADRSALTYELSLPNEFSGDTVECWMYFASENKKRASDTLYLGPVNVV